MKQHRSTRGLVVLAIFLMSAGNLSGQSSNDYKVYDAVIRHMFHDGITRFDMNARIDQIVIRDRTSSEYASHPTGEPWELVKGRLPALSDETIAGYESARKSENELAAKFDIPSKYTLISSARLAMFFLRPGDRLTNGNDSTISIQDRQGTIPSRESVMTKPPARLSCTSSTGAGPTAEPAPMYCW